MSGTEGGGESEESPRSTHTPIAPSFLPYVSLEFFSLLKKKRKNPNIKPQRKCPPRGRRLARCPPTLTFSTRRRRVRSSLPAFLRPRSWPASSSRRRRRLQLSSVDAHPTSARRRCRLAGKSVSTDPATGRQVLRRFQHPEPRPKEASSSGKIQRRCRLSFSENLNKTSPQKERI